MSDHIHNSSESCHESCLALSRRELIAGGAALGSTALLAGTAPALAQSDAPTRTLTELGQGVYRTQNNRHYGLLIDTDEGMIVFDSINQGFADWLNAEIAQRFDKPVRYVVYSHNHADHISGGQAFTGHDPLYVSHALARDSMERMRVDTQLPSLTFDEGFTIELGGRRVDLRYHGPNDGRGSISLMVPDQGVLSVVDWVVIGRMPYRDLARYNVDGTIRSLHEVEAMDFRVASPGHAGLGDKAGIAVLRRYLEAVREGVIEGIVAGESLGTILPKVRGQLAAVEDFRALALFEEWVDLNIRGIHTQIARLEGHQDG